VDLSKNSITYQISFVNYRLIHFDLLFGPFAASPLTKQVKIKESKAIKMEAITPPSCESIGSVPLFIE
jgi:hypothetical protein